MRILVWHAKHDDIAYAAETEEQLEEAALEIVRERLDGGDIFWPDDHPARAADILERGDGKAAYRLLLERNEHEYERISLEHVRMPG
jgi:hypothetical protein